MALVEVRDLVKEYRRHRGWWSPPARCRAVDGVSFDIEAGEILGLVGESGSGKSTTGRCLLRLVEPTSGSIRFRGGDLLALGAAEMRRARRDMQIVFQDPFSSLDPRMRVGAIVEEPLVVHRLGARAERRARVADLFRLVGLDPTHIDRRPHEFSGGQRQRIGLARALALSPAFLVCDEPVSSLDVSVQAQVVNLLLDLHERLGLTLLFIAHDLRLVAHISTRVAVMYGGRLLEVGPTRAVFESPVHPYTRALLSAIPSLDRRRPGDRVDWRPGPDDLRLPLRVVGAGHEAAVG